jgi:hypothetical protein
MRDADKVQVRDRALGLALIGCARIEYPWVHGDVQDHCAGRRRHQRDLGRGQQRKEGLRMRQKQRDRALVDPNSCVFASSLGSNWSSSEISSIF